MKTIFNVKLKQILFVHQNEHKNYSIPLSWRLSFLPESCLGFGSIPVSQWMLPVFYLDWQEWLA
jgi:hypothetical protein